MKITINKETEDEVVDFEYSPTTTIQQVREMAAGKMGCKATNLNVRKYTKAPVLANGKTFGELGITEEDMLSVAKTTRNLEKEGVKYASKQIMNGKTPSTKYQHLMNHAKKAHEENINHHAATHEMFDGVNEKLEGLQEEIDRNKMFEQKEGESDPEYKKRLRNIRNDVNKHVENKIEEQKAKKQKNDIDHQKSLFDFANQTSASMHDATGCATIDEIEEKEKT